MKKSLLFLAAAALTLASCSSDETTAVNESVANANEICFRAFNNGLTRAADADLSNDKSFMAYANLTSGSTNYFPETIFTNSSGTFTSTTKYYWPSSAALDFFAYAPTSSNQFNHSTAQSLIFVVTPSTTISEQVDLIVANTDNKTKNGTYDPNDVYNSSATSKTSSYGVSGVPINFRHTGAKIVAQVKNTATDLKFEVTGWKVGFLSASGTFTFGDTNTDGQNTGSGTVLTTGWGSLAERAVGTEYSSTFDKVDIAAGASATALAGEMILIPQTLTAATQYSNSSSAAVGDKLNNSFIAVKLKILNKTSGTVIADDGAGNAIWAIWPIGTTWEAGKKYTYTIDLKGGGYYETNQDTNEDLDPILEGAEIKFVTVTVDNWSDADETAVSGPTL